MSEKFLHKSVFDDLLTRILKCEFSDTGKLPAEPELQKYYGVSRITIRRAIQDLENSGYVLKCQGKGTIVQNEKINLELQKLDSFSNEANIKGITNSSELISFENIIPDKKIKNKLNLLKNEEVYRLVRIRCINGKKIGLQICYIVNKYGIKLSKEQFEDKNASLYKILSENGITLETAEENIEAILSPTKVAELLEIDRNTALFYRERLTYDDKNRVIEYVEMYYRSDEYKYSIKLSVK